MLIFSLLTEEEMPHDFLTFSLGAGDHDFGH
jgi:hypothetical protein